MTQTNTYTLRDLAELVQERESNIASGSETGLLGEFVREHGYAQRIIETKQGDAAIDTNVYEAWVRAYDLMEQYEKEGKEYDLSDLFD